MVFTAFLDILGFKELVMNNTHNELKEIFKNSIYDTIDHIKKAQIDAYVKFQFTDKLDFLVVSDSIIIWADNTSLKSFLGIVTATTFLTAICMERGVPLRGAISMGNISVIKSGESINVFGDSIVNAYELENKQEWSGVIIDDRCMSINNIKDTTVLKDLKKEMIVEYNVPMKRGQIRQYFVCNWTASLFNKEMNSEGIINSFSSHNKKIDNWAVKLKVDNTIKFFNEFRVMKANS
ncbi:hypothetical protein BK121_08815 [Paenibacillus odorifer]|nr:hypothetical protein BK121_08815 [Paenibacillus odorifer]